MIDFEKYINKEIMISYLGHRALRSGVLEKVVKERLLWPGKLIVRITDKEIVVPTKDILQFFSKEEYDDDSTEYYYVLFKYENSYNDNEHYYMSHDCSVKVGDRVKLWDNEYVGVVTRTGFFTRDTAPYPVEKTWFIERVI